MEELQPRKLDDYCRIFDISLFDLYLKCIFCKRYLTLKDLACFHMKDLSLLWRNNICFACCERCVIASARYEASRHFQCIFQTDHLHVITGVPLQNLDVRCYYCLSVLDTAEKFDLIARNRPTCLVRGYFRAPCRECLRREIY